MRVAYLIGRYPGITHTFILREVRALRRLGVEVQRYSIWRTAQRDLLSPVDWEEWRKTESLLPPQPARLLRAHLRALRRAPRPYVATLGRALALSSPGIRGRLLGIDVVRRGPRPLGRVSSARGDAHSCASGRDGPNGRDARCRLRRPDLASSAAPGHGARQSTGPRSSTTCTGRGSRSRPRVPSSSPASATTRAARSWRSCPKSFGTSSWWFAAGSISTSSLRLPAGIARLAIRAS